MTNSIHYLIITWNIILYLDLRMLQYSRMIQRVCHGSMAVIVPCPDLGDIEFLMKQV